MWLDGYAITLEQYVMADTFFALTALLACLTLAWPALAQTGSPRPTAAMAAAREGDGGLRAAVSGLLIAMATLQRLEGLFAIPVMLGYLAWRRAGWRAVLAFTLAAALLLLAYATLLEDARFGTFGLTQEVLAGLCTVAMPAFADCTGASIAAAARPLCETESQRASHPDAGTWYIFDLSFPGRCGSSAR